MTKQEFLELAKNYKIPEPKKEFFTPAKIFTLLKDCYYYDEAQFKMFQKTKQEAFDFYKKGI